MPSELPETKRPLAKVEADQLLKFLDYTTNEIQAVKKDLDNKDRNIETLTLSIYSIHNAVVGLVEKYEEVMLDCYDTVEIEKLLKRPATPVNSKGRKGAYSTPKYKEIPLKMPHAPKNHNKNSTSSNAAYVATQTTPTPESQLLRHLLLRGGHHSATAFNEEPYEESDTEMSISLPKHLTDVTMSQVGSAKRDKSHQVTSSDEMDVNASSDEGFAFDLQS